MPHEQQSPRPPGGINGAFPPLAGFASRHHSEPGKLAIVATAALERSPKVPDNLEEALLRRGAGQYFPAGAAQHSAGRASIRVVLAGGTKSTAFRFTAWTAFFSPPRLHPKPGQNTFTARSVTRARPSTVAVSSAGANGTCSATDQNSLVFDLQNRSTMNPPDADPGFPAGTSFPAGPLNRGSQTIRSQGQPRCG